MENSACLDNQILTVDVVSRSDLASSQSVHTLGVDFGEFESVTDFRTYENGSYFSVQVDDVLAHGDAWSLASMLSNADMDLAAQEVLYIGEAFGKDGSSNVWQRVRAHEKLQQIYEDHADLDCDIFVAPMSIEGRLWSNEDHISDDEGGPDPDRYFQHFATLGGEIRKASVDLIEHSLIAYFVPHYNKKLIKWHRETPTQPMALMRETGFRLIQVHLSGWWGLARFHSETVTTRYRSHLISHDIPSAPYHAVSRGIAAEPSSNLSPSQMMVYEGQEMLEEAAERTGVTIRVFGTQAPKLRTPPGVVLPAVPRLAEDTSAARNALRVDIEEKREGERRANAPNIHPGTSTYDPETGEIRAGESAEGTSYTIRLHDPLTGNVDSSVIFGDAKSGRSNQLRVMLFEAMVTGLFTVSLADVAATGEHRAQLGSGRAPEPVVEGFGNSIKLLDSVCRIIDSRTTAQSYGKPSCELPSILIGVDDGDALLHDERGASFIEYILTEGGPAGVGIVLVVGDIIAFESNDKLMRNLMNSNHQLAFTSHGRSELRYLNAKYGSQRAKTWPDHDDTPLFVVHQDNDDAVLGFATAWIDSRNPVPAAKAWASNILRQLQLPKVDEWRQVGQDPGSWWTIDLLNATRWFIRRHEDAWILVAAETNRPGVAGPSLIEWAEDQINARYEVDLREWQVGPGTGTSETVFYIEGTNWLRKKDRSESIKRMIARLY